MDFKLNKPTHVFALLALATSIIMLIIYPLLSFLGFFPTTDTMESFNIPDSLQIFFEIISLLVQIIFVFILMILVPILWYFLVNKLSLKKMMNRLKLKKENLPLAILWGFITTFLVYIVFAVIGAAITLSGVDVQDVSNITDLVSIFSIPTLFILVAVQPIAEEFFFRGFLFEKIETRYNSNIAIIITAVLFGIAHMSYGKILPVVLTIFIGIILGILLIKTKNLYATITAHISFNITSLALYVIGIELLGESAIALML